MPGLLAVKKELLIIFFNLDRISFHLGAHLNPAVSISLLTIRKLKPLQCLFYIIGQMIGAFLGAVVVYYLYWSLFNVHDGTVRAVSGPTGTADIFFTAPAADVPHWNSFFDQVVGTAVLMIFIMALINVRDIVYCDFVFIDFI